MYVITNDKCLEKRFDFCLDFNRKKIIIIKQCIHDTKDRVPVEKSEENRLGFPSKGLTKWESRRRAEQTKQTLKENRRKREYIYIYEPYITIILLINLMINCTPKIHNYLNK